MKKSADNTTVNRIIYLQCVNSAIALILIISTLAIDILHR